jgi:cathepsin L
VKASRQAPIEGTPVKASGVNAPDSYDWRSQGAVVAIKDQDQCGSCWAFSAISAQESQYFIVNKVLTSLSEQNLVDCATSCSGCNGGWPSSAYTYVISKQSGKFHTESAYPYTARDGSCKYSASGATSLIKSYSSISSGSETALLNACYTIRPVSVAIDASHNSFQLYKSGVYNECQARPRRRRCRLEHLRWHRLLDRPQLVGQELGRVRLHLDEP